MLELEDGNGSYEMLASGHGVAATHMTSYQLWLPAEDLSVVTTSVLLGYKTSYFRFFFFPAHPAAMQTCDAIVGRAASVPTITWQ